MGPAGKDGAAERRRVKLEALHQLPRFVLAVTVVIVTAIYCVDLRIRRPNADQYLSATELHSVEHFLLEGFQRNLPDNFVSVGIMGCRTGFYLVFSNEGRATSISSALEDILTRMQNARAVPYARIDQCGDYRNHNLALAQDVAREVLESKATWLDAV